MKKFMIGYRWLDEKQTFRPQHYVLGYGANARDAIERFVANREVGDWRAAHCQRQSLPVVDRGIDNAIAGYRIVAIDERNMFQIAAPGIGLCADDAPRFSGVSRFFAMRRFSIFPVEHFRDAFAGSVDFEPANQFAREDVAFQFIARSPRYTDETEFCGIFFRYGASTLETFEHGRFFKH